MTDDRLDAKPRRETRQTPLRPKPLTAAYLERAAVAYLEKFASSAENLRRLLDRKARRREKPEGLADEEVAAMIEGVVAKVLRSGLIDDGLYASGRVNALARRGASPRGIAMKLRAKGVGAEAAAAALDDADLDELALARRFAERKRLGPWRLRDREAHRDRDIAALCRQGFPFSVARQALRDPDEEPV